MKTGGHYFSKEKNHFPLMTNKNYCKKCDLIINSENEHIQHIISVHIRGLMINDNDGSNIMFSRFENGKFKCPTCYETCTNMNQVLKHLFCEGNVENNYESFAESNENDCLYFKKLKFDNSGSFSENSSDVLTTGNINLSSSNVYDKNKLDMLQRDGKNELRIEDNIDIFKNTQVMTTKIDRNQESYYDNESYHFLDLSLKSNLEAGPDLL